MEISDDKENQAPNAPTPESLLESLEEQLPKPTERYPDEQGQLTPILHIGESARSIFMLEKATERRLRLVIALKEGPRSVTKWLELLRCPLVGNPGKYNKMRLVRRALTCVDSKMARETAEYTEICIMLAKMNDSERGVRQNFLEMKKRRVGEKQPLRYEEEAAFEYEAGNKEAAEEILEQGVNNDALKPTQKDEILKRIIAGRAGWVAAFSGSPQQQKVLALRKRMQMQTLRKTQDNHIVDRTHSDGKAVVFTPRGGAMTPLHPSVIPADTTPIRPHKEPTFLTSDPLHTLTTASNATPLAHGRNGAGFSTASKVPRNDKSLLLTTPSLQTRPNLKSHSTLRKPPVRFPLGALRVIASSHDNEDDDDDDDDDDAMFDSQTTPTKPDKPITPVEESDNITSAPSATKVKTMPKQKVNVGDISHILKWNPDKSKGSKGFFSDSKDSNLQTAKLPSKDAQLKKVQAPESTKALPVHVSPEEAQRLEEGRETRLLPTKVPASGNWCAVSKQVGSPKLQIPIDRRENGGIRSRFLGSSGFKRADDHYRSPKRQQLDPSIAAVKKYADVCSPSSASSSSSPPVASMSNTSSRDALELLTSKVVVNGLKYIKLEQIGSGGSSKVYRMLGPDLKIYALKKIKLKKLDQQSIAQYTNEIKLLEKLQGNPHIIKLIAAEQDLLQRQINVIMEHGEIDLSERLRDLKGGMDENLVRVIWTQMLQAVDAIHRMRIIHGDLKPANFLFVNGALKLIDFGIAKAIPTNDTTNIERDSQIGTVNYMSPEAIQGNSMPNGERDPKGKMKVGRASDIWSLGCILYQIVYSKPPFADVPSIIEKFRCIIDPAVPISFPPLQNKDLEDVIRSCLQRDHRRRPLITGESGLLNHPFLRSGGSSASVSSTALVTMANAPQILSQLGQLLRSQRVPPNRVDIFMSIGLEGLRNASDDASRSDRFYTTQERQTDI